MNLFIKYNRPDGITATFILDNGCSGGITITNGSITQVGTDNIISQFAYKENGEVDKKILELYKKTQKGVGEEITESEYNEFVAFAQDNYHRLTTGEDIYKETQRFFNKHRIIKEEKPKEGQQALF